MNAYDFDKTIFDGDSTARFYVYCLLRTPKMLLRLPRLAFEAAFLLKKDKQSFKEHMFAFLTDLKNPEKMLSDFWKKNECRIKKFYF
ncbi:MAG: polysaccharide biosynthesis protein GtrA, partial [Clostridia bacterium]|nr:polysaccharide biosynthesis protein GtrA [Clostridia bacterium]